MSAMLTLILAGSSALAGAPDRALDVPAEVEFVETPLSDVAKFLSDYFNIRVELDSRVNDQQPVTATYKEVPLRRVLARILEPHGLKFEAQAGRILISRVDPTLPPPEYGYRLHPDDGLDGWLALFDGQTTFGWSGAKVDGDRLTGGKTTNVFRDYQLRAYVTESGQITLAGTTIDVRRGALSREVHGRGPIVLGEDVSVRMLAIRPLGLKPLLNGEDLGDWKRIDRPSIPVEKRPQWKIEDGVLRAIGGPGCLEYPTPFGDFVLQADVRTRDTFANGGVFFRSIPGDFMNGYEAQIYNRAIDNDPARPFTWSTGSIDDRELARRVVSRDHVTFRMTVVANGPHIATWVNGYQLVDWRDTRPKHVNPRQGLRTEAGTLQLQAHDPQTDVEFRGIYVAPLE